MDEVQNQVFTLSLLRSVCSLKETAFGRLYSLPCRGGFPRDGDRIQVPEGMSLIMYSTPAHPQLNCSCFLDLLSSVLFA